MVRNTPDQPGQSWFDDIRSKFGLLEGFNGIIQKPGSGVQFGIGLDYGYFLALLAGFVMAITGALRSLESGGGAPRKPPATF